MYNIKHIFYKYTHTLDPHVIVASVLQYELHLGHYLQLILHRKTTELSKYHIAYEFAVHPSDLSSQAIPIQHLHLDYTHAYKIVNRSANALLMLHSHNVHRWHDFF